MKLSRRVERLPIPARFRARCSSSARRVSLSLCLSRRRDGSRLDPQQLQPAGKRGSESEKEQPARCLWSSRRQNRNPAAAVNCLARFSARLLRFGLPRHLHHHPHTHTHSPTTSDHNLPSRPHRQIEDRAHLTLTTSRCFRARSPPPHRPAASKAYCRHARHPPSPPTVVSAVELQACTMASSLDRQQMPPQMPGPKRHSNHPDRYDHPPMMHHMQQDPYQNGQGMSILPARLRT